MKVFLAGNPNVGKSVLFNRLTGARVFVSNYPGTTVDYYTAYARLNGEKIEVIDVPGIYSLNSTNQAEEVSVKILDGCLKEDAVINVLDAQRLKRSLYLTFDLIEKGYPFIMAVNMMDVAKSHGIKIDLGGLEDIIGVPVVGITAISGEGIDELTSRLTDRRSVKIGDFLHGCER